MALIKLTNDDDTWPSAGNNSGNDNIDGLAGNDIINGGTGNDTLLGNTGNDLLLGGAGKDILQGGDGIDSLDGGDDDDQLFGGAGEDLLTGGLGNDTLDGGSANDILDGGTGDDKVLGGVGDDKLAGGAGTDTINGNDGIDVLDGGLGNDKLFGDAGNDFVYGGTGLDTLYGGSGDDYVFGGISNDILYGSSGTDFLEGGDGDDKMSDTSDFTNYGTNINEHDAMVGGFGNDTFYGGYDTMWGNGGSDIFYVKNQGIVYGGTGNDTITVTNSNAQLDSWLEGGFGNDKIVAGSGDDTLFSGYGQDSLAGGLGNDRYVITFDNMEDTIKENSNQGTDTVYYIRDYKSDGRDDDVGADGKELDPDPKTINYHVTLADNIENGVLDDQLYAPSLDDGSLYSIATLTGNKLNNYLQGSNRYDILDGAEGNDTIKAGDGNDIIFAGQGTDTIDGGAGYDLVVSRTSVKLTDQTIKGVENVDLLDYSAAVNATGTSANNLLSGNKFNNTLDGGAGDDILDGWYYSESKYGGVTYDKATVVDPLKITGTDILYGGSGNDLYRIDSGEDKTREDAFNGGVDTVEFKGDILTPSYTLLAGVENLTMVGNLTEGVGNELNNRIISVTTNVSVNTLKGGYGDDYLDGGSGVDTYEGGYGDDTFVVDSQLEIIREIAGQGNDWVQSGNVTLDLSTSTTWFDIENARLTGTSNLNVTGQGSNNYLIGNGGSNFLDGKNGIDKLEGGLGDDFYFVDTTTDTLIEVANVKDATTGKIKAGWIDTINSTVTFSLAKTGFGFFENLTLSGTTGVNNPINGTGNANDNIITGNDSANIITGLGGDDRIISGDGPDTLIGGIGNDTYVDPNAVDIIIEKAGEGTDTIEIQTTTDLRKYNNIENLSLSGGTNDANGTGTDAINVLTGNTKINVLSGLGGNDTLFAKDGADILIGGLGADTIDLTEALAAKDIVRYTSASDSTAASAAQADKITKFSAFTDSLDLFGTIKIAPTAAAVDGTNQGVIKSHKIDNGIIKFDDADTYLTPLSISATSNLSDVIEYLKTNITNNSTVAFQAGSDWWVFQDGGATDTLINLVGVSSIVSLSTGSVFSTTSIHVD